MSRYLDPRHAGLTPYVPGEQPRNQRFIKLNTNESPFPPSPRVLEAISREQLEALKLYSDPESRALNRAIAAHFGLNEDQVVTGNGSDEILAFAFLAFGGSKAVAFPEISYGFYPVFAQLLGVPARSVPLRADFTIDVNDYLTPGENVVIANPNAPTGLLLTHKEIETILRAHPDDVVLIDEAYVDFGNESAAALLPKYENLLIVQTFSKSRSLAGGRVGFALGNPGLIADLQAIRYSFNPYNLGRLPQLAGTAAMEDDAYVRDCVGKVVATRERTKAALADMGCALTDSRANFLFVRLPGVSGAEAQAKLRERGILIRRFDRPPIADYLRVTIGSDAEMDAFLKAVREIITEVHA